MHRNHLQTNASVTSDVFPLSFFHTFYRLEVFFHSTPP